MSNFFTTIEGTTFQLLPQRGLHWPEQNTLFIADTHFGKEATFRQLGIGVPSGSTQGTLNTISAMILESQSSRLVLLGDMLHARSSLAQDVREALESFFLNHPGLRFTLVLGNHDRGLNKLPKHWPIEILEPGSQLGTVGISHVPAEPSHGCHIMLCGHLHPAYRIRSRSDSVGKLPCFWLSQKQFVLPAIGEFTGTQLIKPSGDDRVWIIADNQVLELNEF